MSFYSSRRFSFSLFLSQFLFKLTNIKHDLFMFYQDLRCMNTYRTKWESQPLFPNSFKCIASYKISCFPDFFLNTVFFLVSSLKPNLVFVSSFTMNFINFYLADVSVFHFYHECRSAYDTDLNIWNFRFEYLFQIYNCYILVSLL